MNTTYLKTFIEVVNLKSFSKAADKLYLTQPAVTKQIKALEKDFDIILLRRRCGEIIPTEEGKELYKYSANILNKEDEIYSKFRKKNNIISGELTIFSSSLPANYLLHEILSGFSMKYKDIAYRITKIDSKRVYESIENGVTSFGFTGTCHKRKNIESIEILEDELVLAVPKNEYEQYEDKEVDMQFLLDHDIIIREKGSATLQTFEKALNKINYSLKDLHIKAIVEDNEIIKKMIMKGMGISIISKLSIQKEIDEGLIIPITIKDIYLKRSIFYIYHKNRYFSNIDEEFKKFIINMYKSK